TGVTFHLCHLHSRPLFNIHNSATILPTWLMYGLHPVLPPFCRRGVQRSIVQRCVLDTFLASVRRERIERTPPPDFGLQGTQETGRCRDVPFLGTSAHRRRRTSEAGRRFKRRRASPPPTHFERSPTHALESSSRSSGSTPQPTSNHVGPRQGWQGSRQVG